MNIVITMAGFGTRFKQAGYTMPKYQIEAHGKTLFEWSMLSLDGYRQDGNRYIFIVRREDNAVEFISQQCNKLEFPDFFILELNNPTDGQATTTMLAKSYWVQDAPLMIYNIDTFVEPGEMTLADIRGDGFIPCFHADGDHWSFVELGAGGKAVQVSEKRRISDNCTLGAYYFKSCTLYDELYTEYYKDKLNIEKGEKYVAPLYNALIKRGGNIYISIIDSAKVHVLGTPEELNRFKERYSLSYREKM